MLVLKFKSKNEFVNTVYTHLYKYTGFAITTYEQRILYCFHL